MSRPVGAITGAAYQRLRERNHRLSEARTRELVVLGTRPREDGTLEWKFDPMLATMEVCGTFNLSYAMAFWRGTPGAAYLDADDRARRLGCFRDQRFVEIAGAGHMAHFDRPRELLMAIRDFLPER